MMYFPERFERDYHKDIKVLKAVTEAEKRQVWGGGWDLIEAGKFLSASKKLHSDETQVGKLILLYPCVATMCVLF